MKSALFLASIALVLQLCPSFVINNGAARLVGEFMLLLPYCKPPQDGDVDRHPSARAPVAGVNTALAKGSNVGCTLYCLVV